jgi:hypothetical protein
MSMKKFWNYFLSMSIIASLLVVTSCGDDTEEGPTPGAPSFEITGVEPGEEGATNASVGEEVTFNLNVTAPGGFNRLLVEKTVGEDGTTETFDDVSRTGGVTNDYAYEFSYTPTAEEAGETIYFDFLAVDDDNLDNRYEYVINVEALQVREYDAVLLAAPTGEEPSSRSETFFSTNEGATYSVEEVNQSQEAISATIDFGYFYGSGANDTQATIASPQDYPFQDLPGFGNWTVKKDTKIKPTNLTQSEFIENGNNAEFIVNTFNSAEFSDKNEFVTEGRVNRLSEGEVLAFSTDPEHEEDGVSRHGLILINSISGGATSEGQINISVRVTE